MSVSTVVCSSPFCRLSVFLSFGSVYSGVYSVSSVLGSRGSVPPRCSGGCVLVCLGVVFRRRRDAFLYIL